MRNIFAALCFLILTSNSFASEALKEKVLYSLANFAKDHRIQAIYAMTQRGNAIVSGAQGHADFEQNRRLSKSQIFPISSLTKQVTAVSILMLQDKQLLNVNDKLAKHSKAFGRLWDNADAPQWLSKLTIHNLLTHSSGLPGYVGAFEIRREGGRVAFEKDFSKLLLDRDLSFNPGIQYDYNNTNYYLLGMLVEYLSNKSLANFLKEDIFDQVGMKHSYLISFDEAYQLQLGELNNKYVVRYFALPSSTSPKFSPAPKKVALSPGGDCGVISTISDLIKWNNALHNGQLLSKTSYGQMIKKYFKDNNRVSGYQTYVGYGTYISRLYNGMEYYHHNTTAYGVRCDAGYIPSQEVALAIWSNVNFYIPEEMASKVDIRKAENQIDIAYLRNAMVESF